MRDFQLIYEIELIFQHLGKESLVAQHNQAHIYQQLGFGGTGCLKFMELNKIIHSRITNHDRVPLHSQTRGMVRPIFVKNNHEQQSGHEQQKPLFLMTYMFAIRKTVTPVIIILL